MLRNYGNTFIINRWWRILDVVFSRSRVFVQMFCIMVEDEVINTLSLVPSVATAEYGKIIWRNKYFRFFIKVTIDQAKLTN